MNDVFKAVEDVTGVTKDELKSDISTQVVSTVRGLFYVSGRRMGFTFSELSSATNRHLDSAQQLANRFTKKCKDNPILEQMLDKIMQKLDKHNLIDLELSLGDEPYWGDNFYILDVSSRYFGKMHLGLADGNLVSASKYRAEVANKMIDFKKKANA